MSYVDVQRGTDFEHMASGLHDPQQPPMTSPMILRVQLFVWAMAKC